MITRNPKVRPATGANYVEYGYGQVEPNHLSAQRNGQIYAQLPMAKGLAMLENGQFAKYDYAAGNVNTTTGENGDWLLVYNEVKVYGDTDTDADYAMFNVDYVGTVYNALGDVAANDVATGVDPIACPRLLATHVGDIFTTNTIKCGVDEDGELVLPAVGDNLIVDTDGYLKVYANPIGNFNMAWKVVKVYTMPDGQRGVKIQRIK